jgi:hypothetical protein
LNCRLKNARGIVDSVEGDGAKQPCGKCASIGKNAEWDDGLPRIVNGDAKAPPGRPGGALPPSSAYSPLALRPRDQIRL